MKRYQYLITAAIAASALPANAQYSEDNNALNIPENTDYCEEYINRNTEAGIRNSIYLDQENSSYSAKNINITNSYSSVGYGIYSRVSKYLDITADEGTWSIITMNGENGMGVYLWNLSEASSITNTKIYNGGLGGCGIYAYGPTTSLTLDNVEIHMSDSSNVNMTGYGIEAIYGATVTNRGKGQVTITSDSSGGGTALFCQGANSVIDLENASISVDKTTVSTAGGVMNVRFGGVVSLTNSNIASSDGEILIQGYSTNAEGATVIFDHVNLDNAKKQRIHHNSSASSLNIQLANGTHLDASTEMTSTDASININIESGSSWSVADHSILGNGTLTLDGTSWLAFNLLEEGSMTFANITAAAVALADGAVLQLLGVNADDFESMGGSLTEFTADLFNAGTLSADNVKLVTEDNHELIYTNNGDGTFTVTGVTGGVVTVPEPAAATLGLIGFTALLFRRRKA